MNYVNVELAASIAAARDVLSDLEVQERTAREAFFQNLREQGWRKWYFNSYYYGSHDERGDSDVHLTYYFRPGLVIPKFKPFEHGPFGQNEANDKFDAWLASLADEDYYVVE